MRINTFIVILLVTFIICNNNNHIKGQENNGIRNLADECIATFVPLDENYKTLKYPTEADSTQFIKKDKLAKVLADDIYTFFSTVDTTVTPKTKILTIQEESTVKILPENRFSGNKNYKFPWAGTRPGATLTTPIGSFGQAYSADCDTASMKSDNQLKEADITKLPGYEKIDQYTETLDEIRTAIDDAAIGDGIMLSRADATAKRNYNIFLSKTNFCHYTCKIDNTECDLLVYETANYKSEVVNLATIIGLTGKAKYYKTVKADTVALVDTCAGDGTKGDECTKPQYTVISKAVGKILTGYYKDNKDKYLVSTASTPKMPDAIKAKFSQYYYCFGDPKPQGVSNMFINSILLIFIVILMI